MSQDASNSNEKNNTGLLIARQLSCQRGESVLFENLDLSIEQKQCLHVIGSNGSGKTSLLRILCGLSDPSSGEVFWGNEHVASNLTYFSNMAYIGHKDGLKNELSAIENLRFFQQLESKQDEDALDQALDRLKILHCADILAQGLSFGQRRRLAFARLLLHKRALWILDEPFTGIDSDGRELMQGLCVEHLQNGGAIILTHHQSLDDGPLGAHRTTFDLSQFKTPQEASR